MQATRKIFPYIMGVLLWCLLCHQKCSAILPSNEDITRSTKANSALSEKNHTKPDTSQLLSPGNVTPECAIPWSYCDHEANQYRDILPDGIVRCRKQNTLSVRNSYCLTIDNKTDTLEAGLCLYNYNSAYADILWNEPMCNMHRTGTLCGKCQDG